MRLLDTSTIELYEFTEKGTPRYATLSHRWGDEEVSMQELKAITAEPQSSPTIWGKTAHKPRGFIKIKNACTQAKRYGLGYIWIDTCCIDKTSSAELSEAINSMYQWYARSVVCLTHLADIELRATGDAVPKKFVESEWFRRGWTLQELLAPWHMIFYDVEWREIGTKSSLASYISVATGIKAVYLRHMREIREAIIAERMSWASLRKTTRTEDIAYCLMGIFDVNMPLIYGEGNKAFLRLQQELISKVSDVSIFAWSSFGLSGLGYDVGMLAPEPAHFAGSEDIVSILRLRRDPGGYELPFACASAKNRQAPLKINLSESILGKFTRVNHQDRLMFFTNIDVDEFATKDFHVPLSADPLSDLSLYSSNIAYGPYFIFRLSLAAQKSLHLLQLDVMGFELKSKIEYPSLWQHVFGPGADFRMHTRGFNSIVLHFGYDKRHEISLTCIVIDPDCFKVMLQIGTMRPADNNQGHRNDASSVRHTSTDIKSNTAFTRGKSQVGEYTPEDVAVVQTHPHSNIEHSAFGNCQWGPLGDGMRLWVSWVSKRITWEPKEKIGHDDDPEQHNVVDIDVTEIDRHGIF